MQHWRGTVSPTTGGRPIDIINCKLQAWKTEGDNLYLHPLPVKKRVLFLLTGDGVPSQNGETTASAPDPRAEVSSVSRQGGSRPLR